MVKNQYLLNKFIFVTMQKPLKYTLGAGLMIALSVVAYGLYFYFKPMKDVTKQQAAYSITATSLMDEFTASALVADSKYSDKVLEISGSLKKTEIQGTAINVVFDDGGAITLVASFLPAEKAAVEKLAPASHLKLKGIYKGFIKGDDIFGTPGEIKIDQCTLTE
jgi:hypothetical protein